MIDYSRHTLPLPAATVAGVQELLDACFDEPTKDFVARLQGKKSPVLFLACHEGRAVGFKLSYERRPDECYSWLGGVQPDYRRRGIADELMRRQHSWAQAAGYRSVTTETENRYRGMLILNLNAGFDIVGTYVHDSGCLRILLRKDLLR